MNQFDPYYQWLAIPPGPRPPNHYQLLGVQLFESNRDVIQHAADARMRHISSFAIGPHSELSQGLMTEVSAARVCLSDPVKKAAYDQQLHAHAVQQSQVSQTPTPRAKAPVVAPVANVFPSSDGQSQPTPQNQFNINSATPSSKRYRKPQSPSLLKPALLIGGLLIVVGVLVTLLRLQGKPVSQEPPDDTPSEVANVVVAEPEPKPKPSVSPAARSEPPNTASPSTQVETAAEAEAKQIQRETELKALQALVKDDRRSFEKYRSQVSGGNDNAKLLDAVKAANKHYWIAVARSMDDFEVAEEITVTGPDGKELGRASVVEAHENRLILRLPGRRRYVCWVNDEGVVVDKDGSISAGFARVILGDNANSDARFSLSIRRHTDMIMNSDDPWKLVASLQAKAWNGSAMRLPKMELPRGELQATNTNTAPLATNAAPLANNLKGNQPAINLNANQPANNRNAVPLAGNRKRIPIADGATCKFDFRNPKGVNPKGVFVNRFTNIPNGNRIVGVELTSVDLGDGSPTIRYGDKNKPFSIPFDKERSVVLPAPNKARSITILCTSTDNGVNVTCSAKLLSKYKQYTIEGISKVGTNAAENVQKQSQRLKFLNREVLVAEGNFAAANALPNNHIAKAARLNASNRNLITARGSAKKANGLLKRHADTLEICKVSHAFATALQDNGSVTIKWVFAAPTTEAVPEN